MFFAVVCATVLQAVLKERISIMTESIELRSSERMEISIRPLETMK